MIKRNIVLNRSILFKCVHCYLLKQADKEKKIPRNKLDSILGKGFHIPNEFRGKFLRELQQTNIITNSHKYWIEINSKVFF